MIRRTLDATFLNTAANHPDVRPWVGGDGPLDLTAVIADPANIAIEAEHGGWVLVRHEAGTYELHTMFLRAGRGRRYFEQAADALRYVFTASDAREIVTRVPVLNRGATFAAMRCGFVERFTRKDAWQGGGNVCDVSYQALGLDKWAFTDPEAFVAGQVFHAQIEVAKVKADSALPDHPEDECHDRAVGASALMMAAGNVHKGVWFYNRWARLAGYETITLLSDAPSIIDVGAGVIVEVMSGRMEVLQCP